MISLALVIAVLAIGVAVFTYIQVAFGQSSGFTGPPGSPPTGTGLLTASGNNLGVNTATPSTTLTVTVSSAPPAILSAMSPPPLPAPTPSIATTSKIMSAPKAEVVEGAPLFYTTKP